MSTFRNKQTNKQTNKQINKQTNIQEKKEQFSLLIIFTPRKK